MINQIDICNRFQSLAMQMIDLNVEHQKYLYSLGHYETNFASYSKYHATVKLGIGGRTGKTLLWQNFYDDMETLVFLCSATDHHKGFYEKASIVTQPVALGEIPTGIRFDKIFIEDASYRDDIDEIYPLCARPFRPENPQVFILLG